MGQNFLVDDMVYEAIVDAAQLTKDSFVVEIGTGLGTLTEVLAEQAKKVVTVENDLGLVKKLPQIFSRIPNVTLVPGNILDIPNEELLSLFPKGSSYSLVANIPYYITGKIIRKFILGDAIPDKIIFMVQKEVAERIAASLGKMSMLSVVAQSLAKVENLFSVPAKSFFPEPKVNSAVIRLTPITSPYAPEELEAMFKLAKMGFAHRRKKLSNALSGSLHKNSQDIEKDLREVGLRPDSRAQELTLENWHTLVKLLF